jgi:hypothetical protein
MAFLSEIKAQIGLDITPFEKGLAQAIAATKQAEKQIASERISQSQRVNRELTSNQDKVNKSARDSASVFEESFAQQEAAAKQTTDSNLKQIAKEEEARAKSLDRLQRVGRTVAVALGLNFQSIAEHIARAVVGFSKDQEDALLKLAARSAAAADEMEKRAKQRRGDDDPVVQVKNLQTDLKNEEAIKQLDPELTQKEKNDIMFSKRNFFNGSQGRQEIKDEEARRVKAIEDSKEKISKINTEINLANDKIRAKTEALNKDTAKAEEDARLKILSIDERIAELRAKLAEPAPAETINKDADKLKIAEQANDKAKARADLLDLEKEKQDQINTAVKATAKVREDALDKTLTLEEQILAAKDKVNESEQEAYESKKGSVDQANAELTLAKDRAALAELESQKTKKQTDAEIQQQEELDSDEKDFTAERTAAEEKRTDELDAQLKKLKDQKTTIEQTLAAQAKSQKASVEDIASGTRQVGGTTQSNAKKLLAARSEEQRRIDAVAQAEDTLAGAISTGGRKDAQAELDRRKAALAATQGRKSELEGALKDKTSETFAAEQVAELQTINTTLDDIKAALAATSITSNS